MSLEVGSEVEIQSEPWKGYKGVITGRHEGDEGQTICSVQIPEYVDGDIDLTEENLKLVSVPADGQGTVSTDALSTDVPNGPVTGPAAPAF